MRNAWLIVSIIFAMIVMLLANIRSAYSQPVANGSAGVLLFIFIGFIMFILPKLER